MESIKIATRNKSKSEKRTRNILVVLLVAVFCSAILFLYPSGVLHIILLVAMTLLFFGVNGAIPYLISRKWVSAEAKIKSIEESFIEKPLSVYTTIKLYFPLIEYEYETSGRTHHSDCVSFRVEDVWVPEVDIWGNEIDKTDRSWAGWTVGSTIQIFVDPTDASQSVIVKKMSKKVRSHQLALIVSGCICLFAWALLIS